MIRIEVRNKKIPSMGFTDRIVQGEHNAESFCFHFPGTDPVLTASLSYELLYVRSDQKGTSVPLERSEAADGFNLIWTPDVQATLCEGRFAFMIIAMDSDDDPVWKSMPVSTFILPSLDPLYPVDPQEKGVTYHDLFRDLKELVNTTVATAKGYADEAAASAADASTSKAGAESAQTKAEEAQSGSETARTKSEEAQQKSESAQAGSEAAQRESEAAQASAETAQRNAESALSDARTAQANAEAAQLKAETAQRKSETAQTGAETAQGKAETAQDYAQVAQQKSETAQSNAEAAQKDAESARDDAEATYESMLRNPSIEVDANTGTPSAEITTEGSGTQRHYRFSFHNLKGEKGDKGDKGEQGKAAIGFFSFEKDDDGNLYVVTEDGSIAPQFEYDSASGNLYVVQEA